MSIQVKETWSGVDVRKFGPYREQRQAVLINRLWSDPALKTELMQHPKSVLQRESGFIFSESTEVKVLEEPADEFFFVLPAIPPQAELWYRYEQISGWWMLAHAFWWWEKRLHGDKVDGFLPGLEVQIIGRSWNDSEFRQQLLTDVKVALAQETGLSLPPRLKMTAIEDTASLIHFILPKPPQLEALVNETAHLGAYFLAAHTWWYWMVCARIHSPAANSVTGMVG